LALIHGDDPLRSVLAEPDHAQNLLEIVLSVL
jgi:hypothetical protein